MLEMVVSLYNLYDLYNLFLFFIRLFVLIFDDLVAFIDFLTNSMRFSIKSVVDLSFQNVKRTILAERNQSGGKSVSSYFDLGRYQSIIRSIWRGRARHFAPPGQSFTSNGRFWTHFVKKTLFGQIDSARPEVHHNWRL